MNPIFDFPLPWLAGASLRLSLVLGVFLLARPLLRRFAGSTWLSVLWLVLLVRLLMPWPLATPFGLEERSAGFQDRPAQILSGYEVKTRVVEGAAQHSPVVLDVKPAASSAGWREVWLAGFAAGLAALGIRVLRTTRLARKTVPASDARLLAAFAEIPEDWRCGVDLRETDALSVPTLAGLARPQIWMPRAWLAQLSDAELRHVLLHELGHARRHDLLVQWLFSLAVCIHWFNPLVWIAARCARADREMACDAWVLARSQNVAPDEYGATLLKTIALLREPLRLAPHSVAMAASKRGLFTRIATLGGFRSRPAWRGVVGLLALAAALAALTTTRLGAQQAASPVPVRPADPAKAISKENIDAQLFVAGGQGAALPPVPAVPPAAGAAPAPVRAAVPQIEIAARFVEITDSAAKALAAADSLLATLIDGKAPPIGHVVGLLTTDKLDAVLRFIAQTKGVDLLSTPRVTTKSGQRAVIEIIREFSYPVAFEPGKDPKSMLTPTAFETRNIGVTLEVEPTLGADGSAIDLNLTPQVVELTGYNRVGPGGASAIVKVPTGTFKGVPNTGVTAGPGETLQPIFSTRKITTTVTIFDGQTIVLGGLRKEGDIDEKGQPLEPRQLIIFITAKVISAEGVPAAAGAPSVAPAGGAPMPGTGALPPTGPPAGGSGFGSGGAGSAAIGGMSGGAAPVGAGGPPSFAGIPGNAAPALPVATAVPGKPGFVTSPHAPGSGYIDVRGFPPGTQVRCPYSGKMFLVP